MDSLTHAVSGTALLLALPRRPATAWAVPLTMLVSNAPDLDVFLPPTPVDFLLLHRGITHALAALPLEALLCGLFLYPLWRRGTRNAWTFPGCVLFSLCLLALHVWLDCVTTYGTQIFLPFSDYRVRLNGLFIVDFCLLIPPAAACLAARRRTCFAGLAVLWLFVYSGGAVAWRAHLEEIQLAALHNEGIRAEEFTVLPDAFSPLYWKMQYAEDSRAFQRSLAWNGERRGPAEERRRADPALIARLVQEDRSARIWFSFSLLPLQEEKPADGVEYTFYDWRFASLVPFARKLQERRTNGAMPFIYSARLDETGKLVASRYIGGGGDSGFHPPVTPSGRTGIYRLLGMDNPRPKQF